MQSPFGIFRKHGTILTAGLVVLCMFAFTLADFLQPQHLPAILGMFALGTIFYLLGQPSGKGGLFGVVGALLGLVIVSLVPGFWGPPPAASTAVGDLSEEELQELIQKRQIANQFMAAVYQVGAGPRPSLQSLFSQFPSLASNPQLIQMLAPRVFQQQAMWDRGFQNFGFIVNEETLEGQREATVREWVMAQEADDLGIRVSNATVTEFIKKAANRKLSDTQFKRFREETGLSEAALYDVLRYQIKVKQYHVLVNPTHSFANSLESPMGNLQVLPPEQLWEFYKRATIQQDMDLISLPVKDFENKISDPSEAELASFFEMYKNRFPQGVITRQEGWTQPVEALSPEPAFGVPRRIKLAYFTSKIPPESSYSPTEEELKAFYEKNITDFPNPSFQEPLEDESVPEPLTPGGPAVAQKPKPTGGPAWAEKREYLDFHQAKDNVKDAFIFDRQQVAREENDRRISKLIKRMSELSAAWQIEGEGHMTPQEISDELVKYAQEIGFEKDSYTVPENAWTPEEMTDRKIGQAVEVDINPNPGEGERRVTAATNGATVAFQMFQNTGPQDLFQPNQAISRSEADTRYVYWKIEDHAAYVPEWNTLTKAKQTEVREAWKMVKARDLAKAKAEEIQKALAEHFEKKPAEGMADRDLQKAVDDLKLKGGAGKDLNVQFVPTFQWLQPPSFQTGTPPRLGVVVGVPKAGERFMEVAFNELDPETEKESLGVLVNADGTEYYVGKVLHRQYGQRETLEGLREAYLQETESTPAMQTVSYLQSQQARELQEKWQQEFMAKYNINVAPPPQR